MQLLRFQFYKTKYSIVSTNLSVRRLIVVINVNHITKENIFTDHTDNHEQATKQQLKSNIDQD